MSERQRIDKWLWHARVVKTRTLAQKLVDAGHVRMNGARVEASSHAVKPGDVLTIALEERVKVLEVCGFADKRGNATAAALLYDDKSPPRPPKLDEPPVGLVREKGEGRPTKRDARLINLIKGRD